MAEYIKVYSKNSGVGRNELKKSREGVYDLTIGAEGLDLKSSRDQHWFLDEVKRNQEIPNESGFMYELGKIGDLSGSKDIRID
jgi:hypothetical protein